MIDAELSRATVAFLRGSGLPWPHRSLEAVIEAVGADATERLGPRLKQLADEGAWWPIDWDRHDVISAMKVVTEGLAEQHPELTQEAIQALVWEFSYVHR